MPNSFRTGRPTKFKLGTHYTNGARRPVSATSAVTSKVKGQGRKVTWRVWQVLADKSRMKRPRNTNIGGKVRLPTPRATMPTSFKVKGRGHMVNNTTQKHFISNYNRVLFTFPRWRYQYYNVTIALHCHSLLSRCGDTTRAISRGFALYEYILVIVYYDKLLFGHRGTCVWTICLETLRDSKTAKTSWS